MTEVRSTARRTNPAVGAALLAAQTLSLNVISLLTTAYIVRRLGTLEYGAWATASSLAAAHLVVTVLGLRTVFVREVAQRPDAAAELLAEQLGLRLALGLVASVLALLVSVALGYPAVVTWCVAIGGAWILLSVVSSTLGDLLQSMERFGVFSGISAIAGLAVTVASVAVVAAGGGAVALTMAYLAQPLVSGWLLWREASRHLRVAVSLDTRRAMRLLNESRLLGLNALAWAGRERAVQLIVPAVIGLEPFGLFAAGSLVSDRLGTVPDAVASAFYPRVSRAAATPGDDPAVATTAMLQVGLVACAPMAACGLFLAPVLATILLPRDVDAGAAVIAVTVLALPLIALSMAMLFALQAVGLHETAARRAIVASVASVVLSAAAVLLAGTVGASWALVLRPGLLVATLLPLFMRTFPGVLRRLPWGRIGVALSGAVAGGLLVRGQGLLLVAGVQVAAGLFYLGVLLATRVFSIADLRQVLARGEGA